MNSWHTFMGLFWMNYGGGQRLSDLCRERRGKKRPFWHSSMFFQIKKKMMKNTKEIFVTHQISHFLLDSHWSSDRSCWKSWTSSLCFLSSLNHVIFEVRFCSLHLFWIESKVTFSIYFSIDLWRGTALKNQHGKWTLFDVIDNLFHFLFFKYWQRNSGINAGNIEMDGGKKV